MKPIIMIPARLKSSRLPNKVLEDIHGKPMIAHVVESALAAGVGPVCVACSEPEVKSVAEELGCKAILTDPAHPSGSDRIFEALQEIDPKEEFDVIINLQSDLPNFQPHILQSLLKPFQADPDIDITTLCYEITEEEEIQDPHVVKVILGNIHEGHGRGLYFTRVTPYGEGNFYHHVGIYAYKRKALERFVSLKPSTLEKRERLEQLRALENGMHMGVSIIDSQPMGVDTAQDLEKIKGIMLNFP